MARRRFFEMRCCDLDCPLVGGEGLNVRPSVFYCLRHLPSVEFREARFVAEASRPDLNHQSELLVFYLFPFFSTTRRIKPGYAVER